MSEITYPREIYAGPWTTGHCQGIAVDKAQGYIYFSFTTVLVKMDFSGRVIGTVKGLTGHLGCIDFCEADGRVWGSLEYKDDEIGRGVLRRAGLTGKITNAFYVAIFDVEKIDRVGMDACTDGVMTTVYMHEVMRDFSARVEDGGRTVDHRHGCSGMDGTTFGRLPGDPDGPYRLLIGYGIYGDVARGDNDDQVILAYDVSDWAKYEQPLSQQNMHTCGPDKPDGKYFVRTGNTRWGVQNLEYDEATGHLLMAVYKGQKPAFPNWPLFAIDGGRAPEGNRLTLLDPGCGGETPGWDYPWGATGLCSLGDGLFYVSQDGREGDAFHTRAVLCRWDGVTPLVPMA